MSIIPFFEATNRLARALESELYSISPYLRPSATAGSAGSAASSWLDWGVERTDNGYLVEMEMPGLSREDLSVETTEDRIVSVKGERKTRHRTASVFRSITFPPDADMDTLRATLSQGILTLECNHKPLPEKKRRAINIE